MKIVYKKDLGIKFIQKLNQPPSLFSAEHREISYELIDCKVYETNFITDMFYYISNIRYPKDIFIPLEEYRDKQLEELGI